MKSQLYSQVPPLTAVKGTMKIHQVMSSLEGHIKYRDITCLCQREEGVMDCPCFDLKQASLQAAEVADKRNKQNVSLSSLWWSQLSRPMSERSSGDPAPGMS